MATHSSILTWKIPWTEEPGRHSQRGCKELDATECTYSISNFVLKKSSFPDQGRYFLTPDSDMYSLTQQ